MPRPVVMGNNTILMEYIGEVGMAAPALSDVTLPQKTARRLFDRLMDNVELLLSLGRIHGDLSAYNVLYWQERGVLIDFPQAVDIATNPDARTLLDRDVLRLCQYFVRYGIEPDPAALGGGVVGEVRGDDRRRTHPRPPSPGRRGLAQRGRKN